MPPVVIAAGIGAAAGIGGAVLSSKAQKSAANTAAQSAQDNTTANNALIRETYAQNAARLDPYSANGLRASNVLSESLGLGAAPTVGSGPGGTMTAIDQPTPSGYPGFPYVAHTGQYGAAEPVTDWGGVSVGGYASPGAALNDPNLDAGTRQNLISALHGAGVNIPAPAPTATGTSGTATTPSALSAFDTFRNSTNYKFRLDQGNKGVNQGYAANGMLESGAALKGISDYNQNMASNELGNWQNMLAGQQGMGLSAASALAGVSTNATGSIVASNTNASNAAANAALAAGNANAGMYNSIGSAVGSVAGSIGRTSYNPSYGAAPVSIAGTGGNNVGNWTPTPINYGTGF